MSAKVAIDEFDYDLDDDALDEGGASGYKIKLAQFEGPLDLLLHLIKRAKIQIREIFVSEITSQYLEYLAEISTVDLESAAEFMAMASYLIEIKAKSLLPKPEVLNDPDEDDGSDLIRRLEEYDLFKKASEKMKETETVKLHFRAPDPTVGDERIALKDMNMEGLFRALQKIYSRIEKRSLSMTEREIVRDPFTVAEKIELIENLLASKRKVKFDELFDENSTKTEIITTFQALLELMKLQFLEVTQEETFGEILLTIKDENNGN